MHHLSKSVDIIIPSFRLDEQYLLPVIQLPKPADWAFRYYIVVDNPGVKVSPAIQQLADAGAIQLFINPENLGAAESRNKGINAGNGAWILFLDDDIVADNNLLFAYTAAITKNEQALGFIGLTDFPDPISSFTKSVDVAGLTANFKIANIKDEYMWGVTANMMYNRAAMQELRFSDVFPKSGGGEDVDLPVQISIRHNSKFKCLKEAKVTHPWWNNGKAHFDRFVRYGVGNAHVLPRFKKYTWYGFPNPIESTVLLCVLAPLIIYFLSWQKWLVLVAAVWVFEMALNYIRASLKGYGTLTTAYYMTRLRCSVEWGLLKTGLTLQGPRAFMQRINVDFSRPHHFRLNRWRITKIILFVILLTILIIW
ncbi:glycosyltransferase [Chitinophaga nivalis]|uniref:Glycosyltransferase n=1 Tax=Chitinophaga nivalis TaxID=2991709 RepID=A0ABT3IMN3_9BACT|nr:glycosyltransferase [Chitinophaga nivalis]MCW3465105.1 glycosyltransferase [Chitinophaga nivalis]MCW3485203.1 glycosyltransferase [Chitinophaga nivalis]